MNEVFAYEKEEHKSDRFKSPGKIRLGTEKDRI